MGLWQQCGLEAAVGPIGGELYRIVESQEQVATLGLVDSLDEQSLLEEMLEAVKPPLPPETRGLHYLLATPFRYPPLRHGSRYGRRHEPALFYGSLGPHTCLAECAWYRLLFWHGMEALPTRRIRTRHTLFQAPYAAARGLRLHAPPCAAHQATLAHPSDYTATQALGTAMREAGIDAFEFPSARCPERGVNVALFTPSALAATRPTYTEEWWCDVDGEQVTFLNAATRHTQGFAASLFHEDGRLPFTKSANESK
ncbi:MAG: RES family NAD+ phosphorylase [Thiohalomonadaceae bacterium]